MKKSMFLMLMAGILMANEGFMSGGMGNFNNDVWNLDELQKMKHNSEEMKEEMENSNLIPIEKAIMCIKHNNSKSSMIKCLKGHSETGDYNIEDNNDNDDMESDNNNHYKEKDRHLKWWELNESPSYEEGY